MLSRFYRKKNGGGTGGSKAVVSAVASVVKKMAVAVANLYLLILFSL